MFDKVAKLLKETHRIKGAKNKVEERFSLVENTEDSDVRCFINQIDAPNSKMEICDERYSINCKFIGRKAKRQLIDFIEQ